MQATESKEVKKHGLSPEESYSLEDNLIKQRDHYQTGGKILTAVMLGRKMSEEHVTLY